MITVLLVGGTAVATVGVEKLLKEKYDRPDLAKTLAYGVSVGAILYVVYKGLEFVSLVTSLFLL